MDNREKIYEHGGELRNVQDLFEITANHAHYPIKFKGLRITLTKPVRINLLALVSRDLPDHTMILTFRDRMKSAVSGVTINCPDE
ncbi:MAG: hypothetical protein M1162_01280 [Candidatus Thermoplasmatota archaeon]|nr:hypothetical protein [Candidatus Thermoplasmatota archaeon]